MKIDLVCLNIITYEQVDSAPSEELGLGFATLSTHPPNVLFKGRIEIFGFDQINLDSPRPNVSSRINIK
jgi:hypothetical protein